MRQLKSFQAVANNEDSYFLLLALGTNQISLHNILGKEIYVEDDVFTR